MAEPTKTHPFFQSPFSRQPGGTNRRRSTRVDLVLPVVLSGRDASGETFREETQTATVNLHGAKIETTRNVLGGDSRRPGAFLPDIPAGSGGQTVENED